MSVLGRQSPPPCVMTTLAEERQSCCWDWNQAFVSCQAQGQPGQRQPDRLPLTIESRNETYDPMGLWGRRRDPEPNYFSSLLTLNLGGKQPSSPPVGADVPCTAARRVIKLPHIRVRPMDAEGSWALWLCPDSLEVIDIQVLDLDDGRQKLGFS